MMAVITTLHLDDPSTTGVPTSDPDGVHGGFGSGVGETPLGKAESLPQRNRSVGIGLTRCDVEQTVVELINQSSAQHRVGVPHIQRTKSHVEIHIAVTVNVFDP